MGNNSSLRILTTDVVVIGGSGAGVTAALAAARAGSRVILISKGKVGKSGNAIMAGGSMSIDGRSAHDLLGLEANRDITQEGWFESIVKEGFFLSDQPIVEQFAFDGPAIVKEYVHWAERAKVPFKHLANGKWVSCGQDFCAALKEGMKEAPGVDVLEDTTALEVLMRNGRAVGVLALNIYTGELFAVYAGAVVLGTGGYQPFSLKNSVTDMTGDGVGMGFRAGAEMADMEFLLSFPTAVAPQNIRGSIFPYVLIVYTGLKAGAWAKFRDAQGNLIDVSEDIMQKTGYYSGFKLIKLITSYYWGKAIFDGKGTKNDGIFLDFSSYPEEQRQKGIDAFFSVLGPYYAKGHYKGDDMTPVMDKIRKGEGVEVGLGFEYSMGGLLIDEKMKTRVPGLFAGGEVGSGTFGAMRVADGLVEMLVQGYEAGKNAAAFAKEAGHETPDQKLAASLAAKCSEPLLRKKGISPVVVQNRIEAACDAGFGYRRTEKGLQATLKELLRIKAEDMPNMAATTQSPRYNWEWLTALQMENLMTCVESGVRAAIERKESRGNHIRDDYLEVNHDEWLVRQIWTPDGKGGMSPRREKPRVTTVPLPKGKDASVMEFFLRPDLDYPRAKWGGT